MYVEFICTQSLRVYKVYILYHMAFVKLFCSTNCVPTDLTQCCNCPSRNTCQCVHWAMFMWCGKGASEICHYHTNLVNAQCEYTRISNKLIPNVVHTHVGCVTSPIIVMIVIYGPCWSGHSQIYDITVGLLWYIVSRVSYINVTIPRRPGLILDMLDRKLTLIDASL